MELQEFIIDNRFLVTPSLHAFKDLQTQKEIRLEARLMQLLCLLVAAQGTMVARDRIVREIWNDYGGGDEGLSQAIFYLRKALEDTDKKIIETIPKKGYILHAAITKATDNTPSIPKQKRKSLVLPMLLAAIFAIALLVVFTANPKKGGLFQKEPATTPFPQLEENDHSITTVDSLGTSYKLVQVGDGRPAFYVNGKQIAIEEQEQYILLIHKMSEALQEKQYAKNR